MVVQQLKLLMRRSVTLFVGVLGVSLVSGSCIAKDLEDVESVEIATHVDDWRDEVIYQLMTDRFANADKRNDFRVDPTALGHYQGGDWQGIIDELDYDPKGIQGFTSLGLNGLAPIRFFNAPELFRVLPEPEIFQKPEAYNRRGRVTDWDCTDSRPAGVDKGAELRSPSPLARP